PSFDWQLTNLNNYVNLLPGRTEPHTLGNMSLSSFGGGSAMLGLPGDFTPPSRFVRAAFFQNTAPQKPNAEGSVFTAFHILGSMEIPIGAQFAQGQEPADIPSATQCTCVTDMSGLRFYYRSMYDGGIRCIDLKEINFKKVGLRSEPLIPARKEYVHYIKF
ncbi:MAG: linear amide C-N hydrolase, partial [Bacteroidales bacterium]|nr:linear amide C-N hydrolase [Bacteroidales bacterium]